MIGYLCQHGHLAISITSSRGCTPITSLGIDYTFGPKRMSTSPKHSSSYYGMWGFRDWALSDDERLFAILSGYKYTYSSSAPTTYHRVLEFDVSRDDVWTCMDSYDVSPQFGEYTAIAYDASDDTFWIVHNAQRRVVNYDFEGNGQFTRSNKCTHIHQQVAQFTNVGKLINRLEV